MTTFSTLVLIASGLLTLGALAGFGYRFFRRFDEIERKLDHEADKRHEGQERTEIMLLGAEACLEGLHQQGCNGKVTHAIERLESYQRKKTAS